MAIEVFVQTSPVNIEVTQQVGVIGPAGPAGSSTVASVSGFISSGDADLRYYPLYSNPSGYIVSGQLASYVTTGQNGIFALSSQVVYVTGDQIISGVKTFDVAPIVSGNSLITGNLSLYATAVNLALTGANLQIQINSINTATGTFYTKNNESGFLNSLSGLSTGYVQDVSGALASQLSQSGQLFLNSSNNNGINLSGNLQTTGSTLNTKINLLSGYTNSGFYAISNPSAFATSGNLQTTGQNLYNLITGLSGQSNLNYAAISNLGLTGSTLDNKINLYSGFATGQYATIVNLGTTGTNILNVANSNSVNLSGNLQLTGSGLDSKINALSGYTNNNFSQVKVTGSNILLSPNFTGINGVTVYTSGQIVFISGSSSSNNGVLSLDSLVGAIQITGLGTIATIINGQTIQISGISQTGLGEINTASNLGVGIGVFSNKNVFDLQLNSISGGTGISVTLNSNVIKIDSNLDTGQFYPASNPQSYATSGNLQSTGSNLQGQILSLSGTLTGNYLTSSLATSTYATISNLASTGSNLQGQISSLSGLFSTGNQTGSLSIGGTKTFTGIVDFNNATFSNRPTVNGIGVLLSGEASYAISGIVYNAQINIKNDNGSTIYKGQPVYISSAAGTNILVKLASNTGESPSSKTLGLVYQTSLAQNIQGTIVTEGLLQGFDTTAGEEGDPIWLGPTGSLIFGLNNKPYAPNHLVYLGVVTRKHANQGEVFVKTQNGFELHELHNVNIDHKNTLANQNIIKYDSLSGIWFNDVIDSVLPNTIIYNTGNQTISGVKTFDVAPIVSGNSLITGNLSLYATTANLGLTGSNLYNLVTGMSGQSVIDYATKINLTTTGSTLDTKINNLSGFTTGTFATISNLATTGQQSWNAANNNAINLSGNLQSTGSTLDGKINSLSGYSNLTFATIITTNAISGNLIVTGQTLYNLITGLSGQSVIDYATKINLGSTGSTLDNKINSLSGYSNNSFYLKTNPDGYAQSGRFISGISITGGLAIQGALNISAGSNIALTQNGNNSFSISSSAIGGGGGVTGISITGGNSITGLVSFTGLGGLQIYQVNNSIQISGGGGVTTNNYSINSGSGLFIYRSGVTSGISEQFFTFPTILDSRPIVIATLHNDYFSDILAYQISGANTSGFWGIFSDTVPYTGYYFDIMASNSSTTGMATIVIGGTSSITSSTWANLTWGTGVIWPTTVNSIEDKAILIMTGNSTLNITNLYNGWAGVLQVIQSGISSSGYLLTAPASTKVANAGSGIFSLTRVSGAIDIIGFEYDGSKLFASVGNNYN